MEKETQKAFHKSIFKKNKKIKIKNKKIKK